LAFFELISLLKTFNIYFETIQKRRRIAILDVKCSTKKLKSICDRTVLLRYCGILRWSGKRSELTKANFDWVKMPYCVRVKNLGKRKLSETKMADFVWSKVKNPAVNLDNPRTLIYFVYTGLHVYVVEVIWKLTSGRFANRAPHMRPGFHPASLKPELARLMVNLSCAKKEILDPFCGAGSILIEGGLCGLRVIGIDFDPKMLELAKRNLNFYKIKNYRLIHGDGTKFKFKVESIVTDLPYGRSTRKSENLVDLYKKFLKNALERCLGRLVFMVPHYVKIDLTDWKILFKQSIYTHSKLTRILYVLCRK